MNGMNLNINPGYVDLLTGAMLVERSMEKSNN